MVLWEATTRDDFARFLRLARPGSTALYHVGYLAMDKCKSWEAGKAHLPELSRAIWDSRDVLALTQKKLGPFQYEYRATMRAARELLQREDHVAGVRRGGGGPGTLAGISVFAGVGGERSASAGGNGCGGEA